MRQLARSNDFAIHQLNDSVVPGRFSDLQAGLCNLVGMQVNEVFIGVLLVQPDQVFDDRSPRLSQLEKASIWAV